MKKWFKKVSKKKYLYGLLLILLLGTGYVVIKAASKYYEHRWTNGIVAMAYQSNFISNDIIEIDDGYASVGFVDGSMPVVRILDKSGETKEEYYLDEVQGNMVKRIFAVEGGYLVVGVSDGDFTAIYLTLEGKILASKTYSTSEFRYKAEVYFEEDDDYIYGISDVYDVSAVMIKKKVNKNITIREIDKEDYTDEITKMVNIYTGITAFMNYRGTEYYPTFTERYDDGYVYGLNNFQTSEALIVYIKDNKLQWQKKLEDTFVRDAVAFNSGVIVAMTDSYSSYVDPESNDKASSRKYGSYLQMYSWDGNDLGKDEIANYLVENEVFFYPEHLIALGNTAFVMSGSSYNSDMAETISDGMGKVASDGKNAHDGEEPPEKPKDGEEPPEKPADEKEPKDSMTGVPSVIAGDGLEDDKDGEFGYGGYEDNSQAYPFTAELMYFSIIHKVETKTDGNGKVEATKVNANWGDEVKFTITPNPGFILSEVKVTDSEGNVVIFTDNTFTMPNADVIIEASFKVENPETLAFISIIVFIVLAVSGTILYKNRKKPTKYEEVK